MNKDKSQFVLLPAEDRQFLLELCAKQSYESAVEILAKPRSDGGLGLRTSRSALCRFFTTTQLEATPDLLAQRAAVAQVCYEQRSNTFLAAIRAEVEARVLESLYQGKALTDVGKDLRLLKTAQSLYLADAQWRVRNPQEARAAYQAHVDRCAQAPEIDFVPVESGAPEPPSTLPEPSAFEQDVEQARLQRKLMDEQRQDILAKLAAGFGRSSAASEHRPVISETPKTPVIPHFPPNPTTQCDPPIPENPSIPRPAPTAAPQPAVPKRTPFVREDLKIGRNDPCPCGSGHKYKRCCFLKESITPGRIG